MSQSFTQHDPSRSIRAARGTELTAKSWQTAVSYTHLTLPTILRV